MNVERVTNYHALHTGRSSDNTAASHQHHFPTGNHLNRDRHRSRDPIVGSLLSAGGPAASSGASTSSRGPTSQRDRADESCGLKGNSSSAYSDDDRDDLARMDKWGKLGRCELKLTVKQVCSMLIRAADASSERAWSKLNGCRCWLPAVEGCFPFSANR